jgi:hypothetical protein
MTLLTALVIVATACLAAWQIPAKCARSARETPAEERRFPDQRRGQSSLSDEARDAASPRAAGSRDAETGSPGLPAFTGDTPTGQYGHLLASRWEKWCSCW